MLLAAGLDVNARTAAGVTPLHVAAAWSGWWETGFLTTFHGSPAVIEVLLAAGARVEARDTGGATLLHWAAEDSRNAAVVEALLAAGADVNALDEAGRTSGDRLAESYSWRCINCDWLGEMWELLRADRPPVTRPWGCGRYNSKRSVNSA